MVLSSIGGSKVGARAPPVSKFFHFHAVFGKKISIPVGCVPSTAVAMGGGSVCPGGMGRCLPGGVCLGVSA